MTYNKPWPGYVGHYTSVMKSPGSLVGEQCHLGTMNGHEMVFHHPLQTEHQHHKIFVAKYLVISYVFNMYKLRL